jgi:HEAT repeat protein
MRILNSLLLAVLAASLVSCASLSSKDPDYVKANPLLEEEIETLIRDLPHMHGPELLAAMSRLVTIGEPAIPYLVDALDADPAKTRAGVAFVLGEMRDRRVIPALRDALDDDTPEVRYEVAASLVVLGDWSAIPMLFEAMRDENPYNRYKAFRVLSEHTRQELGYDYQAPEEERVAALRRWETWYAGLRVTRVE